jgi:hypothetical protein
MRAAWRDFLRARAAGDRGVTFGDWLKNAWREAKLLCDRRMVRTSNSAPTSQITSTVWTVAKERSDRGYNGGAFLL